MNKFCNMLLAGAFAISSFATPVSANTDLERIMWELATTSESLENVEAFIENFPESDNIEEAHQLAERIRSRERELSLESSIFDTLGAVSYSQPLAFGDATLVGRTLPEILQMSPAYPPVEGLPEEYWKEKTCSSCHQWTREALCTQAGTYVAKAGEYRNKQHPFGGLLKMNLRNWAQNGCG